MIPYPARILAAVLCILTCSVALIPFVIAAPVTTTTAAPVVSCVDPETPNAGEDHVTQASDTFPVTVQYTDTSTSRPWQPINSYLWDFGDGTTSTQKNPRHTFAAYEGSVHGKHTVTTVCGKSDSVDIIFVVSCTKPVAGFTTDVSSGFAPLTVKITDTSTHTPESVTKWGYQMTSDVGESGSSSPSIPNFQFLLRHPGNYTLIQTVKKDCNVNSVTFRKDIRVSSLQAFSFVTTTPTPTATSATTVTAATTPSATVPVPVTTTSVPVTVAVTTPAATASLATITTTLTGSAIAAPSATTPAAQLVPGTGALSVITNPPGVQVSVDDVAWGTTPAIIPNLAAGAHTLRLEMAGYQNLSVPVVVTEGKTAEYSLGLVPLAASGSGGSGMLPLIIGVIIILALACAGAYLYMKKKKAP